MAAIAAGASGARPRLVCSTTPVALITGASDGTPSRATAARTAASQPSTGGAPPLTRAASTAARAGMLGEERGDPRVGEDRIDRWELAAEIGHGRPVRGAWCVVSDTTGLG